MSSTPNFVSLFDERRKFASPSAFSHMANLSGRESYDRLYEESINHPDKFRTKHANEHFVWRKSFKKVLDWKPPHAKWFLGIKLNVPESCIPTKPGSAALPFYGVQPRIVDREGKIMRRLLKELATSGTIKGDSTTLEDFSVISTLKSEEE